MTRHPDSTSVVVCRSGDRARVSATTRGTTVMSLCLQFSCVSRIVLTIAFALVSAGSVHAADINLLSSGGLKVGLTDLICAFERATEHKVKATYGAPGVIRDRIVAGEPVDVLVFPVQGVDDLIKQDKILADGKVILARSGMGVAVRAGAPRPD